MKLLRKTLLLLVLLALCFNALSIPAAAATATQDGLSVEFTTDKNAYASGAQIKALLTVRNTNQVPVQNIDMESGLPSGYCVASGSAAKLHISVLPAGEEARLEVLLTPKSAGDSGSTGGNQSSPTSKPNPANPTEPTESTEAPVTEETTQPEETASIPQAPDSAGEPTDATPPPEEEAGPDWIMTTLLIIIGLCILGLILLLVFYLKKGRQLMIILLCMLLIAQTPLTALAAGAQKTMTLRHSITIGSTPVELKASVRYQIQDPSSGNTVRFVLFLEDQYITNSTQFQPQQVEDGQKVAKPADPVSPLAKFLGWYSDIDCKTPFDFSSPVQADTYLYAKWEMDTTDTDGDGIYDALEKELGTDPAKADTDGDGLPDYLEVEIGTDPNLTDSDQDGVSDYQEDSDGDTLTNGQEITLGTHPGKPDTDYDGLNDAEELTLGTDPTKADTDGDGGKDLWEINNGFDPTVYNATFAAEAASEEVTQHNLTSAHVTLNVPGSQAETLQIQRVSPAENPLVRTTLPGYLGSAYDFQIDGSFSQATITFQYNTDTYGAPSENFQPRIYYLNEELGLYEELPGQSVSYGSVSANVSHFSTYILLNKVEFDKVWNEEIKKPGTENQVAKNLRLSFVIDTSGSMSGNKISTVKTVMKKFISSMGELDRAALTQFDSRASLVRGMTSDKDRLTSGINSLYAIGGTRISRGLELGISQILTDGIAVMSLFGEDENEDEKEKNLLLEQSYEEGDLPDALLSSQNGASSAQVPSVQDPTPETAPVPPAPEVTPEEEEPPVPEESTEEEAPPAAEDAPQEEIPSEEAAPQEETPSAMEDPSEDMASASAEVMSEEEVPLAEDAPSGDVPSSADESAAVPTQEESAADPSQSVTQAASGSPVAAAAQNELPQEEPSASEGEEEAPASQSTEEEPPAADVPEEIPSISVMSVSDSATLALAEQAEEDTDPQPANTYDVVILLTDGQDSSFNSSWNTYAKQCTDNGIVAYSIGIGSYVDDDYLRQFATAAGGKYYHATVADQLGDYFDDIKGETVDYTTDSNDDGISDYYTKLIFEGKMPMADDLKGTDFSGNADYDGDGLKNGEELQISVYNDRVYVRCISNPTQKHSDMDGVDDYQEVKRGSDPFSYSIKKSDVDILMDEDNYYHPGVRDDYDESGFNRFIVGANAAIHIVWNKDKLYRDIMVNYFDSYAMKDYLNHVEFEVAKSSMIDTLLSVLGKIAKTTDSGLKPISVVKDIRDLIDTIRGATKAGDLYLLYARFEVVMETVVELLPDSTVNIYTRPIVNVTKFKSINLSSAGKKFCNGLTIAVAIKDVVDTHRTFSTVSANNAAFDQNIDILNTIANYSNDDHAVDAAKDVLNRMAGAYGEAVKAVFADIAVSAISEGIKFFLSKNPYTAVIVVVQAGLDLITGISEDLQQHFEMFSYTAMSRASAKIINWYTSNDGSYYSIPSYTKEESVIRNLTHLAQMRILGEKKFCDWQEWGGIIGMFDDNAEWEAAIKNQVTMIKNAANRLDLVLHSAFNGM